MGRRRNRGLAGRVAICVSVVAAAAGLSPAEATTVAGDSPRARVAAALRTAARTSTVPRTFSITYSSAGGYWPGNVYVLRANGRLTRSGPGPTDAPETRTVRVRRQDVVGVIKLLVAVQAWRQGPPGHPAPMHGRLRLRVAGAQTSTWETETANTYGPRLGRVAYRLRDLYNARR